MKTNLARQRHSSHGGKGRLGCLFGFLLLGSLTFGLYRFAPPYMSQYQLKDAAGEIATLSSVGFLPRTSGARGRSTGTVEEIQDAVLAKAKELEIPLEREDIQVRKEGQQVYISVSYVVPLDLIFTVFDYKIQFTAHN